MFLRQLDLTTALRPSLFHDESLLFVQDGVGLYEGKFKIAAYQDGHAYLTSHRVCYVDNKDPRKFSVAVDLKEIERTEFYPGFLKSSPKITLFPKPSKGAILHSRNPLSATTLQSHEALLTAGSPMSRGTAPSPAPVRDINTTWICTICGFSNAVPAGFDPATANEHTILPPCQACGIKPAFTHMVKAAISAMSNRTSGVPLLPDHPWSSSTGGNDPSNRPIGQSTSTVGSVICPRCTFHNHASLSSCEMCGAPLTAPANSRSQILEASGRRAESPAPAFGDASIVGNVTIETIKFSFRAGGDKVLLEKLKGALIQRKWLLQSAPPPPRPANTPAPSGDRSSTPDRAASPAAFSQRVVGIAGLERKGAELRQNNQAVIGTAFEDLEALMTSAKEVIEMAEQFARQTANGNSDVSSAEARLISDSAAALGLTTTKDMLGSGSAADQLYITELSRDLAEFLTDDRSGILRKEGGIISLIDLWQIFNQKRNGIELVSPLDFEKAANMWETLRLPIRLRRFKSGLLVVQERSRTDDKTIASIVNWLREPQYTFPPSRIDPVSSNYGRGVTAQQTAERFGWSVGVATEELEMAEEIGELCRDQSLDGTRFWVNCLMELADTTQTV